jgi:predicted dehydrogenase
MRVVIIGLGSIGEKHIFVLRKINPKIQLFAYKRCFQEEKKDIKNFYSLSDLQKISPSFIIISNPTDIHYDTLNEIYKFNIPLFIEKPLFNIKGDKEFALVKAIHSNNSTYIACNLRFHKGVLKMKELLQNKRVEEVNIYCGSYLPNWRPNKNFRNIYSSNKDQGGGVHIDLIHELDYLYWIFGEPLKRNHTFSNSSSLEISAYDYANYLWQYKQFNANVVLNYYRKDTKRTFEVLTSKGTFLLDLLKNKIWFNDEQIYFEEQNVLDLYEDQMRFFLNNALNRKNKFNTIKEGYKILELCF